MRANTSRFMHGIGNKQLSQVLKPMVGIEIEDSFPSTIVIVFNQFCKDLHHSFALECGDDALHVDLLVMIYLIQSSDRGSLLHV